MVAATSSVMLGEPSSVRPSRCAQRTTENAMGRRAATRASSLRDDHIDEVAFDVAAVLEDELRDERRGDGRRVEVRAALEAV